MQQHNHQRPAKPKEQQKTRQLRDDRYDKRYADAG